MSEIKKQPCVIACAYDSEVLAKKFFGKLLKQSCINSGITRIQAGGRDVLALVADDEAAASYSSRLPWGPGVPMPLPDEICTALVQRRSAGAKRADEAGGQSTSLGQDIPIFRPASINHSIIQAVAQNTSQSPWPSVGGICGASCPSYADAAHVREVIVNEHLDNLEGMVAMFGNERSAAVVGIADTLETDLLLRREIERLAGPLSYRPDDKARWTLWTTRIKVGSGPFPMSVSGTAQETADFLTGAGLSPNVKLHTPGRNQPCICGSGRKYKHCCGG